MRAWRVIQPSGPGHREALLSCGADGAARSEEVRRGALRRSRVRASREVFRQHVKRVGTKWAMEFYAFATELQLSIAETAREAAGPRGTRAPTAANEPVRRGSGLFFILQNLFYVHLLRYCAARVLSVAPSAGTPLPTPLGVHFSSANFWRHPGDRLERFEHEEARSGLFVDPPHGTQGAAPATWTPMSSTRCATDFGSATSKWPLPRATTSRDCRHARGVPEFVGRPDGRSFAPRPGSAAHHRAGWPRAAALREPPETAPVRNGRAARGDPGRFPRGEKDDGRERDGPLPREFGGRRSCGVLLRTFRGRPL
jgi:hypothetical protein